MTFVDLMNSVFRNCLDFLVIVFIDDIVVYLKDENDHMGYLRVVLQFLKDHQLFTMYRIFDFWLRLMAFHGHIISSGSKG